MLAPFCVLYFDNLKIPNMMTITIVTISNECINASPNVLSCQK